MTLSIPAKVALPERDAEPAVVLEIVLLLVAVGSCNLANSSRKFRKKSVLASAVAKKTSLKFTMPTPNVKRPTIGVNAVRFETDDRMLFSPSAWKRFAPRWKPVLTCTCF